MSTLLDDEKFLSELEASNKAFKFYHTDPAWLKHNIPYAETVGPTLDRLIAMVRSLQSQCRERDAHLEDCSGLTCGEAGDLNWACNQAEARISELESALREVDESLSKINHDRLRDAVELARAAREKIKEVLG